VGFANRKGERTEGVRLDCGEIVASRGILGGCQGDMQLRGKPPGDARILGKFAEAVF